MYWWNATNLTADLRRGDPPARDVLGYLIGTVVFWTTAGWVGRGKPSWPEALEWTGRIVMLSVVLLGVVVAYRANGGGTGRSFVVRWLALGWVFGNRLTVLVTSPLLLVALWLAASVEQVSAQFALLLVPVLVYQAVFIASVAGALRDVAGISSHD